MNKILMGLCFLMCISSQSVLAQTGNTSQTQASPEVKGEFFQYQHTAQDGKERPYVVYQPNSIQKGEKRPLIVYLHGAISTPTIRDNPIEGLKKSRFLELADKGRYYVLFPYGQKGATWFDDIGSQMVFAQLEKVKKEWTIDEERIFLSGFSDGASGTLYIAATQPSVFAGFVAFNGSLPVAAHLGAGQVYPGNLSSKPMYIINTTEDMLYSADMMAPVFAYLKRFIPQLQTSTPAGMHDLRYLSGEITNLIEFLDSHQRQDTKEFTWETDAGRVTGLDWLMIREVDVDAQRQDWHTPYRLTLHNDKASFGIQPDLSYQQGYKVAALKDDSTAAKMGVQVGDVILKMGDTEMENAYAPYIYLASKKAGDSTSLTIKRGDETVVLEGKFNPGYDYEVFEKNAPSAKVKVRVDNQTVWIETSAVKVLSIDTALLPKQVEKVWINQKEYPLERKGVLELRF